jgi:diadenosine tetraphosphatase ApaH/serine/threonine PP2A family protein phosphatase
MEKAAEIQRDILEPAERLLSSQPSLLRISGRTLAIGDLHGDLEAATSAVELFGKGGHEHLLFLGDYVDRGRHSVPLLELIIKEMLADPGRVHMLRGNHETLWVNDEHGFRDELVERGLGALHIPFNDMFSQLPIAAVIDGTVLAVHGGVPEGLPSLDDIKAIRKGVVEPKEARDGLMLGLMWNDPKESLQGFAPNTYRGYMNVFGRQAFEDFMGKNELKGMVRGHQRWPEGYRYFFDTRILSVFSCASYCPNVRKKAATVDNAAFAILDL